MLDALVNIWLLLALKILDYCPLLIKLMPINKTLKLQLFESLLDLSKWELYRVVLRAVWHVEYPFDTQFPHLFFHSGSLMSC